MCGTALRKESRSLFNGRPLWRTIPWFDIALLLAIIAAIGLWWTKGAPAARPESAAAPAAVTPPAPTFAPLADTPEPNAARLLDDTPTPSPVTPTATPPFVSYKIVAGDTLSGIAARFGVTLDALLQANKLSASARLAVGQQLLIPTAGMKQGALAQAGTAAPTATPDDSTLMYRVKAGDTLSGIALEFKSTVAAILEANKLKPDAILRIGQVLIIPRGTPTPTMTPTAPSSPTPTPGPPLAAPVLLGPAHNAILAPSDQIVLRWLAAGVLSEEDWYVVRVWSMAPGGPNIEQLVKGTSLRLDPALRLPDYVGERGWRWQVVVARFPGLIPSANQALGLAATTTPTPQSMMRTTLLLLSAPSETRAFSWQ